MGEVSLSVPSRVLVVDDDQTTRALARQSLEQAGFLVGEASNGHDALAAFQRLHPDLVLLDVMMPQVDGFTTCRWIRALDNSAGVPIVMVTGLDDLASIDGAYEAGATDFIAKPIRWATLQHRVRYMVRQKQVSDRLRESESRLANAQRIARVGNWEWDVHRDRLRWSDEVYRIFGIRPYDFKGSLDAFLALLHEEDSERVTSALKHAVRWGEPVGLDYRALTPTGRMRMVHQECEVVRGSAGHVVQLIGTVQDITRQREAENRIRYLAFHDPLTSLANQGRFREVLAQTVSRSQKHHTQVALLFVGLDRFKRINDTFGHEIGDAILKVAAERTDWCLEQATRHPDRHPQAVLSRFGGDEFTVLLETGDGADGATKLAHAIMERLAEPFRVRNEEVYLTASIGIALCPGDADSGDELMKNANAALRHAKAEGRNGFRFYTPIMNADAHRRLALESDLQRALSRDEFILHFQPKVDMISGQVVGMEALVRWRHPRLGTVPPAEFIPIAEECGLITALGEWVLRAACEQNQRWQEAGIGPLDISVNLSARQFWQNDLADQVARILAETGLDPCHLELELTEGTFMENADGTIQTLTRLKALGIKLSVDDFGTGYSSLAYLQRFPIDSLKVDRSFVQGITTNPDSAAIARTIIAMARNLNLYVVAEGVETEEQLVFLRNEGCHQLQGYLFSPPVDAAAFTRLLREGRCLAGVLPAA